jgi:hypothetical protein
MISGHLAISALMHHYTKVDAGPALIGGIFPDVVDKAIQVGGLATSGRTIGHTLLSWALSSLVVWRGWGNRAARAWAAGYMAHLLADADGFVPWFFPFRGYCFPQRPRQSFQFLRTLCSRPSLLELVFLTWWLVISNQPAANSQRSIGER